MKTNSMLKKFAAAFLAVVMVISLIPATPANAAGAKKMTMYVGEEYFVTNYTKVKRVSSSKKSVVKVRKDSSANYKAILKAKKAGTATVTVRTQRGTMRYKITVKKLNFKVSLKVLGKGEVLATVINKTKNIFDSATLRYTFVDANGITVARETKTVSTLIPGKASYVVLSAPYNSEINISASKAGVVKVERSPNRSYKNRSSKVKATPISETSNSSEVSFQLNTINNCSANVSGVTYVLICDASNNIIGIISNYIYLKGYAVDTSITRRIYRSTYPDFDHYKIVTRAYSSVLK